MEQLLSRLNDKERLDVRDASELLQFLQSQAEAVLSHQQRGGPAPGLAGQPEPKSSPAALENRMIRDQNSSLPDSDCVSTRNKSVNVRGQRRRDGSTGIDLNSFSEFPPMMGHTATQSSSHDRMKEKSPLAKPGRRITLTPLTSPAPATNHFSSPNASENCWMTNPAFTNQLTSSEQPSNCLSEERKLLQQERSRRKPRHGSRTVPTHRDAFRKAGRTNSRDHASSWLGGGETQRERGAIKTDRGRDGCKSASLTRNGQSSGQSSLGQSLIGERSSIDIQLRSHSIFELNSSARGKHSAKTNSSMHSHDSVARNDHFYEKADSTLQSSEVIIRCSRHGSPSLPTPPLTSTPLVGHRAPEVSLANVTNKTALDTLSHHYSSLIKGHMLPNLTSEVHFILQLLTVSAPHTPALTSSLKGSSGLFELVDNCVYFAVAVIDKIKDLFHPLDRSTLQLLADNSRIADFNYDLSVYFASLCEKSISLSVNFDLSLSHNSSGGSGLGGGAGRRSFGVPFQEETDNSKNFPTMKAFHAFKKQRDLFYLILRDWEEHHYTSNWNMADALRDKIKMLIQQHGEICSLAPFAKLFQRQLVESCRRPLHSQLSPSPAKNDFGSSLMGKLGKTDPERLKRLTERFFLPSAGSGLRPPPSFSPMEEFFTNFIIIADSYNFNHHLEAILCSELLKLHSGCGLLHPHDVEDVVYTMRSLSKFLAFLHFLPHRNSIPESLLHTRQLMVGPLDLRQCVKEACGRGHISLTIPWVVTYLSLADRQAYKLTHVLVVITALLDVYRSLQLQLGMSTRTYFLLTSTLGWYFESPNFPSSLFFEHLKTHPSPSLSLSLTPDCLDSKDIVTVDLLYACCGFLGEFRSILAGFAAGLQSKPSPMRKIKPISTDIESAQTNPDKQLQTELQENFFRAHPTYLKQLCDLTAERVSLSAIANCEANLLEESLASGVQDLTQWLKERYSTVGVANAVVGVATDHNKAELPFTQNECDRKLFQVILRTYQRMSDQLDSFITSFCPGQCMKVLNGLLSETLSDHAIKATIEIASSWAREKILKWSADKLRGIVREELSKVLERTKRLMNSSLKSKTVPEPFTLPSQRQQQRHCDIIRSFAATISSTNSTPALGEGVDKSMERLKEEMETVLLKEGSVQLAHSQLLDLCESLKHHCHHIYHTAFITPDVVVPQALPRRLSEKILSLSADVAVLLVSQGLLTWQKSGHNGGNNLIRKLLLYWKLMKTLRLELPIAKLLNGDAFEKYFSSESPLVWVCLGDVIISLVLERVFPSSLVEGLWLCRRQQLHQQQVVVFLKGASIFLERWFTLNQLDITPDSPSPSPSLSSPPSTLSSPPSLPSPPSQTAFFEVPLKEIHFVRLLSLVLNELDEADVPQSLLSYQTTQTYHVLRHSRI